MQKKKIVLIDMPGTTVRFFSTDEWDIVLVVVGNAKHKKDLMNSCRSIKTDQIYTVNDLVNMPFQKNVSVSLLRKYKHLESDFIYNSTRYFNCLPKLKYIYQANLGFWHDLFMNHDPELVVTTQMYHAQVTDIFALGMAKDFNARSYFMASVAGYRHRTRAVVNFASSEILAMNDTRVNTSVLSENLYGGTGGNYRSRYPSNLVSNEIRESFAKIREAIKNRELLSKISIKFQFLLIRSFGNIPLSLVKSVVGLRKLDYATAPGHYTIKRHHSVWHAVNNYFYMKWCSILEKRYSVLEIPNRKYIFYPLHLEPEANLTNSEFNQQLYLIEMIADNLPDEWVLVVKEHPNQFNFNRRVGSYHMLLNFRAMKWADIYRRIAKLDKVILVRNTQSSKRLINASAIFSVSGSITLEGMFENIPTACSVGSFYGDLNYYTRTIQSGRDIREFLEDIDNGVFKGVNFLESIDVSKICLLDDEGYKNFARVMFLNG